jgi:hypothetical protein
MEDVKLSRISLHARVDSEAEAHRKLSIFEFEPLCINESLFCINSGDTDTTGRQKCPDLRP